MLDDLASGRPMDRLICGDVGFGKTEVALRAAFVAAMNGKQVAVVVPTTLAGAPALQDLHRALARLSGATSRRPRGSSPPPSWPRVKKGLADGTIDIVVGTHALLGKAIKFKDLGLIVVDEEQHFGVAHKEKLKQLRAEVHVLTLTATPIPRTLQLALSGVREMSIIATPPVDRLAVRTFVVAVRSGGGAAIFRVDWPLGQAVGDWSVITLTGRLESPFAAFEINAAKGRKVQERTSAQKISLAAYGAGTLGGSRKLKSDQRSQSFTSER